MTVTDHETVDPPGHGAEQAPAVRAVTPAQVDSGKNPVVVAGAMRALRIAIAGLFLIYTAPLLALAYWFLLTSIGFKSGDGVLSHFSAFIGSGDQSLSLIHRALLPLMAGMAPIAFKDDTSSRWSTGLMIGLLLAIALSILFNTAFHTVTDLRTFASIPIFGLSGTELTDDDQFLLKANPVMRPVYAFFERTQEVMSMYLLMLFGLTLSKTSP